MELKGLSKILLILAYFTQIAWATLPPKLVDQ